MKKTFETTGRVVTYDKDGKAVPVPPRSVVELDVDGKGLPVSRLFRGRVRALNVAPKGDDSVGETLAAAQAQAEQLLEDGEKLKAEAEGILDQARKDGEALLEQATAEAKAIVEAAKAEAEALKTPPPPPAKSK